MKKQNHTGWYFFGSLGGLMLLCGLLWGVLIAPMWGIMSLAGLVICGFVACYWPNDEKEG